MTHLPTPPPCVATIGFFDGVHRGHRCLIGQVRRAAAERGCASAVITFGTHPRRVMQSDFMPQLLTLPDEKVQLLRATGTDRCHVLRFTLQTAALTAREFMQLLQRDYGVQTLVVGYDHRFGHNRSEGFADYVRHGRELGMEVLLAAELGDVKVSSSAIRQLLAVGDVTAAGDLLGYNYFIEGSVVSGHQVGRELGFPTANLRLPDPAKLVPADGVYAVRATLGGETFGGMLCIGHRPTLHNGTDRSIEVHLLDFDRQIYGQALRLSFAARLRSEQRFASIEALRAQLALDREAALQALLIGKQA